MIVATIGAWSVLSIFPQTEEIARALLASSAVLAVVAGLALSTPLGNLGAGVLVAFTQPVRIGDRVTIGDHTGFVEQINMIYTALVTDDERRVFVPNTQLTNTAIVNRTIRDPRRIVTAERPGADRRAARGRPRDRPSAPSTRSRASIATARRCSWATSAATSCCSRSTRRRRSTPTSRSSGRTCARPRSRALADAGHLAA